VEVGPGQQEPNSGYTCSDEAVVLIRFGHIDQEKNFLLDMSIVLEFVAHLHNALLIAGYVLSRLACMVHCLAEASESLIVFSLFLVVEANAAVDPCAVHCDVFYNIVVEFEAGG
jgi:hypothetical protein